MAAHTKLWYFERFRMLDALNDQQRRHLEKATRMLEAKRGQRIYLAGDPSDQIFLIKSGIIKICMEAQDRREVILALLNSGDIFGELAVVDDAPRDHRAEAYADCVLCAMDRETILRLIREVPELGFQITKLIGLRLRTFRSRVEELLCKSAHARVAHALLELAGRHGIIDAGGILIPLRVSQRDLGRLVGLSRETVNGILHEWREQQLVDADRTSIRVHDPARLRCVM